MLKFQTGFQGNGLYQCFDMERTERSEEILYVYIEKPTVVAGSELICNTPECQNHLCNYSRYFRVNPGSGPAPQNFPEIKLHERK